MSIDYKLIGTRIKNKRRSKSITQEKLAEQLGVSVGYISQVERGTTKANLDMLSNISVFLECDITEFLTDSNYESGSFLRDELNNAVESLDSRQRKIILGIIEVLKENI